MALGAVKKVSILSSQRRTKFFRPYIHTHTHLGGLFQKPRGYSMNHENRSGAQILVIVLIAKCRLVGDDELGKSIPKSHTK